MCNTVLITNKIHVHILCNLGIFYFFSKLLYAIYIQN